MVLVTARRLISLRRQANLAMEAAKIGQNMVKKVPGMEPVKMDTFWAENTAHDIRLIGVGLEDLGVDDFVKGEYWDGELYVDINQESYKALGYRRFNFCNIWMSVFAKKGRDAISKGRADKVKGDFKGDGLQNGGLLIVKKGGSEVLMSFKQDNPADHVENSEILKALNIRDPVTVAPVD